MILGLDYLYSTITLKTMHPAISTVTQPPSNVNTINIDHAWKMA
jgi:hypothetical protein